MVLYAERPRFKSPVCTGIALSVLVLFSWGVGGGGDTSKVERKFPTTFWNM